MKRKMLVILALLLITILFLAGCGKKPSVSPDVKDEFPLPAGSTIRIVVPYSPGGGYDVESRLTAPFIKKHLEEMGAKNIDVIVENVTGGGGSIATTQVYREKPDGKTIMLLDPESSLWQQMLKDAHFDIKKFVYLGQRSADPIAFIVDKRHADVDDFHELRKKSLETPLLMATAGHGGHDHMYALLFAAFLEEKGMKINFEFLHLDGTGEIVASFRRGEIDGTPETIRPFLELIEKGEAKVLFTFTQDRTPLSPDAPTIFERKEFATLSKEDLINLTNIAYYRRVFVAPPGTDERVSGVLAEAIKRALNDPELINKSKEAKRPIFYIGPQDIQNTIASEWAIAEKYLNTIKASLQPK